MVCVSCGYIDSDDLKTKHTAFSLPFGVPQGMHEEAWGIKAIQSNH